jgi:HK97 family phage portal protein
MVAGIDPVHPSRVEVVATPDGQRLIYAVTAESGISKSATGRVIYDQDDIIHVAGFGFDGIKGLSMLRYALRMAGGAALSMQDFAANFFANSARPDYVLQADAKIDDEQANRLYARIDERHRGPSNAHRPMLLGNGLKYQAITMPLDDMQLLDQRRFQIEEIARIYGVPAFMIGHTEKTTSWGAGVEQMGTGFVRYALRQHLNKFETEFNRKLFRTASRVVKFDTTELERADTKSLMESLRIGIGRAGERPIISVNEARAVLHRNKKDGGDDMQPIQSPLQPSDNANDNASDAKAVAASFADAIKNMPATVVNVEAPQVNIAPAEIKAGDVKIDVHAHIAKRGEVEKTVTGYDENGRILSMREKEIDNEQK